MRGPKPPPTCRQTHSRLTASGDRWDEHDLVTILKGVAVSTEEANVLFVHVDVDEAAKLPVLILDLGGESGKCLVDVGEETVEVFGCGVELFAAIGVAGKGGGEHDFNGHQLPPATVSSVS